MSPCPRVFIRRTDRNNCQKEQHTRVVVIYICLLPSFLVLTDCARVREKGENFVVTTDFTDHTELVASIIDDGETRNFIVI